jgi:hypothetical protein
MSIQVGNCFISQTTNFLHCIFLSFYQSKKIGAKCRQVWVKTEAGWVGAEGAKIYLPGAAENIRVSSV